jgi:hypothetical protein
MFKPSSAPRNAQNSSLALPVSLSAAATLRSAPPSATFRFPHEAVLIPLSPDSDPLAASGLCASVPNYDLAIKPSHRYRGLGFNQPGRKSNRASDLAGSAYPGLRAGSKPGPAAGTVAFGLERDLRAQERGCE